MRERVIETLRKAASEFINLESNRRSMITVTKVTVDRRGGRAYVFVSVLPEKDTHAATDFLNRQRDEFRQYLKKNTRLHMLPRIIFMADPVIGGTIEPVAQDTPEEEE